MLRRARLVACLVTTASALLEVTTFLFVRGVTPGTRGTFNELQVCSLARAKPAASSERNVSGLRR